MNCRICEQTIWWRGFVECGDVLVCNECAQNIFEQVLEQEMSDPDELDTLVRAVNDAVGASRAYADRRAPA